MAAVADPLENFVDREIIRLDANCSVAQFVLVTGLLAKIIATCTVHPGGPIRTPCASGGLSLHRGAQAVQHGVHVMMSAKGLMRAHEATRGIVRLRIPSSRIA